MRNIQWAAILAATVLTACGSSDPASGTSGVDPSTLPRQVMLEDWRPLAPAPVAVSDEVRLARERILGPNATDPDRVRVWWFGVSSFVMSIGGHLVLLDAWESIGLHANYVPIGREELVEIKPEAIFIGHGHFDHAADAGYVAAQTGAIIVGAQEHCDTARSDAEYDGFEDNFSCLITGTEDTPEPGVIRPVQIWADLPPVQVIKHIHSSLTPELSDPGIPFIHIPNLLPFIEHLNTDPREYARFLRGLGNPMGGAWAYHFSIGDFTLLWHNSSGPINTGADPFSEAVQEALASLPGCVDVQLGAIVGFNQPLNGLRDPLLYVKHAAPKLFLPNHHDAWAPVVGGGARGYEAQWRRDLATLEHQPALDYLRDPEDFMKRRSYNIHDPFWKTPAPGSRCAGVSGS
jgi:hypothetical protein